MEGGAINTFLDQFLGLADQGFGLIQGDVGFVLNALIVLSIVLAGAQWVLAGEAPMAPFFRKVLFVGLFAFLVNNWEMLASAVNESGALLGLRAGGSSLTLQDLHDPGRVAGLGEDLFGRTIALSEGMNIITDFPTVATIFTAAILIALAFFVLALQVFVALIAFKLGSLAAFVALPWGVFSGTAWVAERPIGWVATSAVRLFLLAFVVSVSVSYVEQLPAEMELEAGGALHVLLFACTILALSWLATTLASEVMQGSPSLSAAQPAQGAAAGAATLVGSAATARMALSSGSGSSRIRRSAGRGGGGAGSRTSRAGSGRSPNYAAMRPRPKK